jgi:PAS domain S-box-containing protein
MRDAAGQIVKWLGVAQEMGDSPLTEKAEPRHELDSKPSEFILPASEAKFKRIVDATPGLIWSALPDGQKKWVNQHYLDYAGLSPLQPRGWGWMELIHPDDLGRITAALNATVVSREVVQAEARLRRHDGEYRWFLFSANAVRDEDGNIVRWYGINTDIEERKRAEEELRRSEAFLAEGQYLARMGNFSWRIATGEIIWSEPLYRIFAFEPATSVTLDLIASRIHPDDMPSMSDMIERAQRGESDFEYEHRLLMPDDSIKCLHLIAHRTQGRSSEVEYIGAVLDVTQRRLAEEALSKARSELAHVSRVMSLGALTASIAHEVNQPLSGIITNAGTCLRMLAADPPNVEGARETARRTIRDGHRAAEVVTRLRALFSKRPTTIEVIDLNDAAHEVIALLRGELDRGAVVLSAEFAGELPLVSGDRVQLQQVIMNMLRNAADALLGIEGRPRQVVIRTEPDDGDHVRLTVRDVGVGLGAGDAERFFEAFYTTKSGGMGIGLAVSRAIIESHRGRLWAVPGDGAGASFVFSIPAHRGDVVRASEREIHEGALDPGARPHCSTIRRTGYG